MSDQKTATDIGNGFILNKHRGIVKDGKVMFSQDQLTALILFHDICKSVREEAFSAGMGKVWECFFHPGNGGDK